MDQPFRATGLAVLLIVVLTALVYGAEGLAAMANNSTVDSATGQFEKRIGVVGGGEPEVLAFTEGGFSTGMQRIQPNAALSNRNTADSQDGQESSEQVIAAGLYSTTFDAEDCAYQLLSGDISFDYLYEPDPDDPEEYTSSRVRNNGNTARAIGEDHLHRGRMLVSINGVEPDAITSTDGCGTWVPWSPLQRPLTRVPDGDYWKGDVADGEYSVPPGCLWEKVAAFRGGRLDDVVDGNLGPGTVMINAGTHGLRIRKCQGQTLTRIGDAAPFIPEEPPNPSRELSREG